MNQMSKRHTYEKENENLITTAIENAAAALENAASSIVTDYIKDNVEYRASSGLKETIIREELASCCKWCHALAGEYEYGMEPSDIYRRHDNCKCIVLFKSAKGKYQDVWSKKKYDTYEKAKEEKIKELTATQDKEIAQLTRKAINDNEPFIDIKDYWYNFGGEGKVIEDSYYFDGVTKHYLDGGRVFVNADKREKDVAEIISNKYGKVVHRVPEVKWPQNKKTPDYIIDNEYWDLKSVKGNGDNTIRNAIRNSKEQSKNFIIDITNNTENRENLIKKIQRLFEYYNTAFVNAIIVVDGDTIISIYKKM